MLVVGREYFSGRDHQLFIHPEPAAEDAAYVEQVRDRLREAAAPVGLHLATMTPGLELAFRLRIFMTAPDAVTAWTVIQPPHDRRREPTAVEEDERALV